MNVGNNTIIAEFMGLETISIKDFTTQLTEQKKNGIHFEIKKVVETELKYDTDWNWLMEVGEKIKKLGYWIRTQSANNGSHLSMFIGKTGNQDAIIQYGRSKAKEVYYIAFLEFIKWYNSQKN